MRVGRTPMEHEDEPKCRRPSGIPDVDLHTSAWSSTNECMRFGAQKGYAHFRLSEKRCSNPSRRGPHIFLVTHSRERETRKDVGSQAQPDTSGRSLQRGSARAARET